MSETRKWLDARRHSRGEVCAARSCPRGIRRQLAAPDGSFVADECSYPVPRPFPQHRVSVLAAGDEDVRPIILQRREGEMSDGARVSGGDEGDGLWMGCHGVVKDVTRTKNGGCCRERGALRSGKETDGETQIQAQDESSPPRAIHQPAPALASLAPHGQRFSLACFCRATQVVHGDLSLVRVPVLYIV